MLTKIRNSLLGNPLSNRAVKHERLSNPRGLAIFASDALSSTAYATEEILFVLVFSGAVIFYTLPIALAITLLIVIVSISYRQAIFAYPQGGGVYNVAKDNLGEIPALIGASSLLIDYVLTAAVSVAAGVAAITSVFPVLYPHRIAICILVIFLLKWINLRGIRESGKIFTIPAYLFMGVFVMMISYGFYRYFSGTFPISSPGEKNPVNTIGALGIILLCRAFASGCAAMTGIEAISNGIQAFKSPESKNASRTLVCMAGILVTIFLGITFLAIWGQVIPTHDETVISKIAKSLFGRGFLYFLVQGVTTLILILAANTPFAGLPRVASQLARDGYFPKQFGNLGSRLVFTNGIILLACFAWALIVFFRASVHALIPLYAVGVFLGFSLSQLGMIVHWKKLGNHNHNILINLVGFVATFTVFLIVFLSKFFQGAWILIPAVVCLVMFMKKLRKHYVATANILKLDGKPLPQIPPEKTFILLVSSLDKATIHALDEIKSFKPAHIIPIHVTSDPEKGEKLRREWADYVPNIPIQIIYDEYRDKIPVIVNALKNIESKWANDRLIVILVERIPTLWFQNAFHNKTGDKLQEEIENDLELNVETMSIPFKIGALRTEPTPA